jgi:hypothetical protein
MSRDSRNSRRYRADHDGTSRRAQMAVDFRFDKIMPRKHPFIIFALGIDACAKCRKPRSEHT